MLISELLLYSLAKFMSRSQLGHSDAMKQALASPQTYAAFRSQTAQIILDAAATCGIRLPQRNVVDLGCFDGAVTSCYLEAGAANVFGVDIDKAAIAIAEKNNRHEQIRFLNSTVDSIPLPDSSADVIMCYDVFEHVSQPWQMLRECHRILRPGGQMLIGTWGWYHPFAPHLWSTMPVPWAHVMVSERTLLRTCRRVYNSPWYHPTMHDLDEWGRKKADKFMDETIPLGYLNKLLIRDFEAVFAKSDFEYSVRLQPYSCSWACWTKPLLRVPFVREFLTSYIWVTLNKAEQKGTTVPTRTVRGKAVSV